MIAAPPVSVQNTVLLRLAMLICAALPCLGSAPLAADDWPRFRGPNGAGLTSAPGLPVEWTTKDYRWETLLPGVGHSSPVVINGKLFVTCGSEDGLSREIVCLDAADGKMLWTRALTLQSDKLHAKNSYASATPAVSKDFVIASFADDERYVVAAFTHGGEPVWNEDLGTFESQHGHGASPIIWRHIVIVPNDQKGPSSFVGLDIRTGRRIWTAPREPGISGYGTPLVVEREGLAPQLIASSQAMGVTSLDPATGMLNWKTGPLPQRTVSSPAFAGGTIFQSCGQGGRGVLMIGVDPFAQSDDKRIVFERKKLLPYVPTPIACEGCLFLWNDNGVVDCLDQKTFESLWEDPERVDGKFSASPICVNGLLYAVSEAGEVAVARISPRFEVIGRSPLGDDSHATPAVADGKMYFRTFHKVLCLAPRSEAN